MYVTRIVVQLIRSYTMAGVFRILFCMLLHPSAMGKTHQANFYEDKSRANYVFRDPLFNMVTSSLSKCTAKCNIVSECYGVSLNDGDSDCRGYKRFADPSTILGTKVWKKDIRCHPHYTYTESLNLCWKWYAPSLILDWGDAKAFCLTEDSMLIAIDTTNKLDHILQAIRDTGDDAYYWVGGQLVTGTWTWLDGTPVGMQASFWGPNEPNGNAATSAACIGWNLNAVSHGRFDDGVCTDKNRFICVKL